MTDPAPRLTLDLPPPTMSRVAVTRPDDRSHRADRLILCALAAVTFGVAISAVGPWPVGAFQDDGIYAILAKSLASGQGYRYLNLPGAPHATHFPPAYPLFLAALWKLSPVFPSNVALFTLANAVFLGLTAAFVYQVGRVRFGLSRGAAAVVSLAAAAGVPALVYGVLVLSEPMFMVLLLPTLVVAERAAESGRARDALVAGVLVGVLAMVRSVGEFVLPGLVLVMLVRRRWTGAALALAGALVFLVPWKLWVNAHGAEVPTILAGKYGPYDAWLLDAIRRDGLAYVWDVFAMQLREVQVFIWETLSGFDPGGPPPPLALRAFICMSFLLLLVIGVARMRRRMPVTVLFTAAYAALVLVWPFWPNRFITVMLPVIGLFVAGGVQTAWRWRPSAAYAKVARMGALVAAVTVCAGYVGFNVRGVLGRYWEAHPKAGASRATHLIEWALKSTRSDDLLATDDDALVHLYSGRRTIPTGSFTPQDYVHRQTYAFAAQQLDVIIAQFRPKFVLCSTLYCVRAAQVLMRGERPKLRVFAAVRNGGVYLPLSP